MRLETMRTLKLRVFTIATSLLALGATAIMPLAVQAQSIGSTVPASSNAGAVMNHEIWEFNMRRQQPFFFRPITPEDAVGPPTSQESVIHAEEGVFPEHHEVQGILKTPSGNVIIGPSTR